MMAMMVMLLLQAAQEAPRMTSKGWAFLIIAWVLIFALTFWTFSLILRSK